MTDPARCPICHERGMTPWNPLMTARACSMCGHVEERTEQSEDGK